MKSITFFCSLLLIACNEPAKTTSTTETTDTAAYSETKGMVEGNVLTAYRWKLKELSGKMIGDSINGQEPYLSFNGADSTVGGRVGCNRFGGRYQTNGDTIRFSRFFSTKMACADMSVENTFLSLIDSIDRFMVNDRELRLMRGKEFVAIFDGQPL